MAAWVGFTMPLALALIGFALRLAHGLLALGLLTRRLRVLPLLAAAEPSAARLRQRSARSGRSA